MEGIAAGGDQKSVVQCGISRIFGLVLSNFMDY